ncbi:cation:proton antiporter [Thiohalobacter thiocyanaticus]|uniref:Sodium:proton antiporter n=1 Tax=Thiohalobacter thiocyanaticus TaxID=585455 RepID=A0A426QE39_9GAMM|nr:sodium:proton antiporter [Thiohalobacter thiocyanaticus]RRQ20016.1 sodium:proton antiporter [Thiohalobacter thiocyanaticus]
MHTDIMLTLALIGLLAILCQWFAWWVKLPAILFLLLTGIVAGPMTGWLNPDALFGELLFPIISLSVGVILFEGALTLRFREIVGLETVVRRMVSSGVLVTWAVVSAATYYLLAFPLELAILFGAIMVVTGPTVIVPMLRTVRPNARISNILRWEGIVIDPLGALLAVLVFEFIISGQGGQALEHTLLQFAKTILVGVLVGGGGGIALEQILRRHLMPEYLHNVAALVLVFVVFAVSDTLMAESGLLSVTVMGIWLANRKDLNIEHILNFKESLSVLLISGLFILLAARLDLGQIQALGWPALAVLAVLQFVARPLKVMVSAFGSSLNWRERALLSWIAPRGIVAAAVAAIFSLQLQQQGYPEADMLVPLTFIVIIGTVVLQSATAGLLARLLKVAEPEPRGFLIVGANPVARTLAESLVKHDYDCLLCDTNWSYVRTARMHGLKTFYGHPVSQDADRRLDLVGLGRLLALSPQREVNALAVVRYRREFGEGNLYTLLSREEGEKAQDKPEAGYIAFSQELTYQHLAEWISLGAEMHETKLSENFDFDAYYEKYFDKGILLFALDPRGRLQVIVEDKELEFGPGWTLLSLVRAEEEKGQPEPEAQAPA